MFFQPVFNPWHRREDVNGAVMKVEGNGAIVEDNAMLMLC